MTRGVVVLMAAALGGCAAVPPAPETAPADRAALAAPFEAEGRLSARRGNDGVAGQFAWTHDGAHDRIVLSSPLGATIARLSSGDDGVRVETSDGRVETAPAWDALSQNALGFPLPVAGLSAWLIGAPRADTTHTLERDAANRPALLRQDGWEIVYAYADAAASRPSRLTLRYPGAEAIEVRIVVDRWQ